MVNAHLLPPRTDALLFLYFQFINLTNQLIIAFIDRYGIQCPRPKWHIYIYIQREIKFFNSGNSYRTRNFNFFLNLFYRIWYLENFARIAINSHWNRAVYVYVNLRQYFLLPTLPCYFTESIHSKVVIHKGVLKVLLDCQNQQTTNDATNKHVSFFFWSMSTCPFNSILLYSQSQLGLWAQCT